jgi:hypothetical protein
VVYGTTLGMYMAVAKRLEAAAPNVRVLAMGDSLALTQFQPDVFARDHGLPENAVFNASYLGLTSRSQENLLRHIGTARFQNLQRVLLFINAHRLTTAGNADADIFRVAIPNPGGPWQEAWRDKRIAPILDYSRVYGLSRYLVSASWRQLGRAPSWDAVEFLLPQGGVSFPGQRPPGDVPVYLLPLITTIEEAFVADLKRVVTLFRARGVEVVMLPSLTHPRVTQFSEAAEAEAVFQIQMHRLAGETGSAWVPLDGEFRPPADTDYLDYGHLNRSGAVAFTRYIGEKIR